MSGWIKLSRDIKKHWIWQDKTYRCWWLDLLMEAAWAPYIKIIDRKPVQIGVGQMEASYAFLGEKWCVDKRTAKKFIMLLEAQGMVTHTVYHKYAILTICNFEKYQSAEENECTTECTSESTSKRTGECTTRCTSECTQIKEDKEDKEYIITSANADVRKAALSRSLESDESVDWEVEKKKVSKLEKPKKPRAKKPAAPTLVTKARAIFEEYYKSLYEEPYYWAAKDATHMKQLLQKIKFSRENRPTPLSVDDESLLEALKKFLEVINKSWVMDNFSVPNINAQYNNIVSEVKNKQKPVTNGKSITTAGSVGAGISDSDRQQANILADVAAADEKWHREREQSRDCVEVIALPVASDDGV